jgi:hypothetical protein
MAEITPINLGTSPNDGTGDTLREGGSKINTNFSNLNTAKAEKTIQVTGLTLTQSSWTSGSTFYEYELTNANITADSIVEVIPANADYAVVQAAQILPSVVSASGKITIYAVNQPTANIGVTINITTKAS